MHGVCRGGDAIADRVHCETQVGAMAGGLLDDEVGRDSGHEHGADPALSQPWGKVVTGEPGQLLVVDNAIVLAQRGHLLDQLCAGRIRPERLLRITDGSHETGVPDQLTRTGRDGEPSEHHRHSSGPS